MLGAVLRDLVDDEVVGHEVVAALDGEVVDRGAHGRVDGEDSVEQDRPQVIWWWVRRADVIERGAGRLSSDGLLAEKSDLVDEAQDVGLADDEKLRSFDGALVFATAEQRDGDWGWLGRENWRALDDGARREVSGRKWRSKTLSRRRSATLFQARGVYVFVHVAFSLAAITRSTHGSASANSPRRA